MWSRDRGIGRWCRVQHRVDRVCGLEFGSCNVNRLSRFDSFGGRIGSFCSGNCRISRCHGRDSFWTFGFCFRYRLKRRFWLISLGLGFGKVSMWDRHWVHWRIIDITCCSFDRYLRFQRKESYNFWRDIWYMSLYLCLYSLDRMRRRYCRKLSFASKTGWLQNRPGRMSFRIEGRREWNFIRYMIDIMKVRFDYMFSSRSSRQYKNRTLW